MELLTVEDIGSKAFSNALVEIVAEESYLSVVRNLTVAEPKDAHRAIASGRPLGGLRTATSSWADCSRSRRLRHIRKKATKAALPACSSYFGMSAPRSEV